MEQPDYVNLFLQIFFFFLHYDHPCSLNSFQICVFVEAH